MPVIPDTIKTQINALINQTKVLEQEQSQEQFCSGLSVIITNAILSATVNIAPNSIVTVGSATTQTNPAPVLGTLS